MRSPGTGAARLALHLLVVGTLTACARAPEPRPAPQAPDAPSAAVASAAARERVQAFLAAYRAQAFRGLPSAEQSAALQPHFSPRLNGLLRDALAGQQAYRARHPDDKPPLVDGDLFSSLFEGATQGRVESVEPAGDGLAARVDYAYVEPGTGRVLQRWTDRFLLVRDGPRWAIDDVEYQGGWDFAPRGRLSAALAGTAALRQP